MNLRCILTFYKFYYVFEISLNHFYWEYNKGKTSGSRVRFVDDKGNYLDIHKPHPGSIMKAGTLKSIMNHLTTHNHLK